MKTDYHEKQKVITMKTDILKSKFWGKSAHRSARLSNQWRRQKKHWGEGGRKWRHI